MSLRRENTAPPRMLYGASMRQPRNFTPPQQRRSSHGLTQRRGSLGHLYSSNKKPLIGRSNSFSCANDDLSPTKLDFQSLKKRPSLLGAKFKSGNKDPEGVACSEKHSIVMLGTGGVGKTGKLAMQSGYITSHTAYNKSNSQPL